MTLNFCLFQIPVCFQKNWKRFLIKYLAGQSYWITNYSSDNDSVPSYLFEMGMGTSTISSFSHSSTSFLGLCDDMERSSLVPDNGTYHSLYEMSTGVTVLFVSYGSFSLIAFVGNFLVMWVLTTTRRLQSVTNTLIANLALADIIIWLFLCHFREVGLHHKLFCRSFFPHPVMVPT